MIPAATRQNTMQHPQFPFDQAALFRPLTGLITPMGVQASGGELYRGAIFGRDSLRLGLDLVPWFSQLAETVIFSLAHYQSTGRNPVADATRAGQIPHEIRSRFIGPRQVTGSPAEILVDLAARWGGTGDLLVYYGSADATPQFVRLVSAYCQHHGPDLLDVPLKTQAGEVVTLRDCVLAATRWAASEIEEADQPLLGFQRLNREHGHRWQILQDGATSILHADGHLANGDNRVETIGLQGMASDCLTQAATLLADVVPEEASRWLSLAGSLQAATLEQFWMDDEQYFATGFDRDPTDGVTRRRIEALTAIPVELLETGIFDSLPEADRARYVSGIVHMAHGPEFMTAGGIRSRALRHADLLDYPDYHGVFTCWGVTNSVYAAGLARQGLTVLQQDIVHRHLGMLASTGALHEFMYVDRDGKVRNPLEISAGPVTSPEVIHGTNKPEIDQAWTLSFALRSMMEGQAVGASRTPWQQQLVDEIASRQAVSEGFPSEETIGRQSRPGILDREGARQREAAWMSREKALQAQARQG
jgi:glycogen debranching enzyme